MTTVAALLNTMATDQWGQLAGPSAYETGRLVALAPWLPLHRERVRWLLDSQTSDGLWGNPSAGDYRIVPSLSAIDALLACNDSRSGPATSRALQRLGPGIPRLPDTPGAEILCAGLVESINRRISTRLTAPPDYYQRLDRTRHLLRNRTTPPPKLLHMLEVDPLAARSHPRIRPATNGSIGASPAATAAWLGNTASSGHPAMRYLHAVITRFGGPVPCCLPIITFERAWVLGWLAQTQAAMPPCQPIVDHLTQALGPHGASTADGLPPDADTTASSLHALALAGHPHDPDILHHFELDTHYCTWPGEDGVSVSTNAHVLEAFGIHGDKTAVAKIHTWLASQQQSDGSWRDRWHLSPFYATFCAAQALATYTTDRAAVTRASRWALEQHPTTREEAAYAIQILRRAHQDCPRHLYQVLQSTDPQPALWVDKDLYHPTEIVHAIELSTTSTRGLGQGLGVVGLSGADLR